MRSYQQFFAELKRRHVFKVAAIYGATSFVLLQIADLLVEALKLPPDFLTMITVLVLLGFPVALILAWAFETTPTGVRRAEAASEEELAAIVAQPASARWPAGLLALAGIAALVLGAWWVGRRTAPGPAGDMAATAESAQDVPRLAYADDSQDDRPSIAVLPFADMSAEGDQDYFSDGMTEEIINTLARIEELRVAGRTSAFNYKDRTADLRDIGQELGVQYVVEGSVRKDGDQLRITAQLIDTSDGSHIWTDRYDRTLEGVFAIQTEIAEAIAEELRVPLGLDDPAELVRPVSDFDAYDLYLAARSSMRERGEALNEAVQLYEAAIAVDSTWAPAWAGLAEAREIRLWYREAWPEEAGPLDSARVAAELAAAEQAARRALDLDPRQASAHVALGSVYRDRFEWKEAERHFRIALQLDPDNPEVHHQYSEMLTGMGRLQESVQAAARAVSLDPAPVRWNVLAGALENDGRLELARRAYERGMAVDPQGEFRFLAGNYLWSFYRDGNYDSALALAEALPLDRRPDDPSEVREFFSWLKSGDIENVPPEARSGLEPIDWLRFGYPDSAAAVLTEESPDGFTYNQLYEFWDPHYDPIRSHPRMQAFLRRFNLEGATPDRTPPGVRDVPAPLRDAAEAYQ